MISAKTEGVYFTVESLTSVSDVMSFYHYFELISPVGVAPYAEISLSSNSGDLTVIVLQVFFEQNHYKHVCVTEYVWKVLKTVSVPFQGEGTVKDLCTNLGFDYNFDEDSESSWWMIPSLNYKGLLSAFNKWAVIPNGGAPRFFLDQDGRVTYIDLYKSYNYDSKLDVLGSITNDVFDGEWFNEFPANVQVLNQNQDQMELESVENDSNLSWAKLYVNDHTLNVYKLRKQAFLNEYNYRKYTMRTVMMSDLRIYTGFALGSHVVLNNIEGEASPSEGVITGLYIPFQIGNEDLTISLKISCPN